jgi:hypothetical protein
LETKLGSSGTNNNKTVIQLTSLTYSIGSNSGKDKYAFSMPDKKFLMLVGFW